MRVVILNPSTKGHVIQRMRNPKIAMVRYVQYSQKVDLWYCKYLCVYNTDQHEISGQYLDNENVSGDAVLWRRNKSKMADGSHFEDRLITISPWKIVWFW